MHSKMPDTDIKSHRMSHAALKMLAIFACFCSGRLDWRGMQANSAGERASMAEKELRAARKAEAERAAELQQLQSRAADLERDAAALPQLQQRIQDLEDEVRRTQQSKLYTRHCTVHLPVFLAKSSTR